MAMILLSALIHNSRASLCRSLTAEQFLTKAEDRNISQHDSCLYETFSSWNTFRWPITCPSASHSESPFSSPLPPVSELRCVCNWSRESPGHKCFQAVLTLAVGGNCMFGCAIALLTSFQMSPSSSVGKVSQDPRYWEEAPVIHTMAGMPTPWRTVSKQHMPFCCSRAQCSSAIAVLHMLPWCLFLCAISWDNKSVRQEVCVQTAPAAILAGLMLSQHTTALTQLYDVTLSCAAEKSPA